MRHKQSASDCKMLTTYPPEKGSKILPWNASPIETPSSNAACL